MDRAQPSPSPDGIPATRWMDLVLEGGGVKGIALAGALEVLEERGYRANRVAGSSAGAIAGALITADIPASRIVEILQQTDYRAFEDGPFSTRFLLGKAWSILWHNGIHPGRAVAGWLEEQLRTHGRPGRTGTFADLRYREPDPTVSTSEEPQFRLVVTASDLSAGVLRFLPRDAPAYGKDPDQLGVVEAVRASTSIPLFFRPVRWRTREGKRAYLVDGGMLSNFPVSVFDRPPGEVPRWPTFGIKLSARPEDHGGVVNAIRGPLSFGKAIVDTVTGFYDRMHIASSHSRARTIFVDTAGIRPTQFDLSEEDREMLHRKGREAATAFLDGSADQEPWDFARYIQRFRSGPRA